MGSVDAHDKYRQLHITVVLTCECGREQTVGWSDDSYESIPCAAECGRSYHADFQLVRHSA